MCASEKGRSSESSGVRLEFYGSATADAFSASTTAAGTYVLFDTDFTRWDAATGLGALPRSLGYRTEFFSYL